MSTSALQSFDHDVAGLKAKAAELAKKQSEISALKVRNLRATAQIYRVAAIS
jgi:hypothetical protein